MVATGAAAGEPASRVHVVRADGTDDHELSAVAGVSDAWPLWSPDGRGVLTARTNGQRTWPVISSVDGTGSRDLDRWLADVHGGNWDYRWSPDGAVVLAFDMDGRRAIRIDAATGELVGEPWTDLDWPVWQRAP
jgi:dipeptidyl aminopeptidase/acylaminoacyl peptidase